MPHTYWWIAIALLLVGCDGGKNAAQMGSAMQPIVSGQVWTYHTRPGEEASRIVICRVEDNSTLGQIVHIHVNGVRMQNKRAPGGLTDQIGHMPYSSEALRKSLVGLESTTTTLPRFKDGYQEWRTAFDQGKAGVWTSPVAEAIDGMERVLNQ